LTVGWRSQAHGAPAVCEAHSRALIWIARIWLHGGYMKARKQKARPCEPGQVLDFLVPLDGIELSTFALRMRCSTD
jgi:hypothetical protein